MWKISLVFIVAFVLMVNYAGAVEVVVPVDVNVTAQNQTFLLRTNTESVTLVCGSTGEYALHPRVTFNLTEDYCPTLSAYSNLTQMLNAFNLTNITSTVNSAAASCSLSMNMTEWIDRNRIYLDNFRNDVVVDLNGRLIDTNRQMLDMNTSLYVCNASLGMSGMMCDTRLSVKDTQVSMLKDSDTFKNYIIIIQLALLGGVAWFELGGSMKKFRARI